MIAFDAASGKRLWETRARHALQQRSRRRPARDADGRRRRALRVRRERRSQRAGRGHRQGRTGRVNVLKQFGGSNINWGLSESPLVLSDRILVNAGGRRDRRAEEDRRLADLEERAATRPATRRRSSQDVGGVTPGDLLHQPARARRRRRHRASCCGATARSRTTSPTSRRRSCAATACSCRRTTAPGRRCSS